jgi:cell division protease FtsH
VTGTGPRTPEHPDPGHRDPETPDKLSDRSVAVLVASWVVLIAAFVVVALLVERSTEEPPRPLPYSELAGLVDDRGLTSVTIDADGSVTGELRDGEAFTSRIPTAVAVDGFVERLIDADVVVEATDSSASGYGWLLSLLPYLVFLGVLVWFVSRRNPATGGVGAFGRSKATLVDEQRPTTTFEAVAGYGGVKDEVLEVVDYLRHPERYHEAGAVGPGGVLMVGPPGTGKTLIARAIAGEADVPFFSVTGSSFVELFVGVGASRVRDLFAQARKRSPAIVFIDEIDAIGQRRGRVAAVSNDEREQTLNQLLAEMDGFGPAEGVVVLAATNRPDVLDPALTRPGRFDRQVVVPLPNQVERSQILEVHCRDKHIAPDVDLWTIARGTSGFSGADLANLANEAAIVAVREDRVVIAAADFDAARDRLILGRRDRGNVLLDERHIVAVHEAGHAVVAALSPHADPVSKVSILPAGGALGVTHQLPIDERHLYTESYLRDALAVRLGGRAAEHLVLGQRSSGAADDLASATRLAGRMVRELGLSDELGPVGFGPGRQDEGGDVEQPRYGAGIQSLIDQQVTALLREAERRAQAMLSGHRVELGRLVDLLVEKEVLDGVDVYRTLGVPMPETPDGGRQGVAVE